MNLNPVMHGYFASLSDRIYCDDRVTPKTRELMLALLYAVTVAEPVENRWEVVREVLNRGCRGPERRVADFVLDDLPRYDEGVRWRVGACVARRRRPFTPKYVSGSVVERDPWLCHKRGDGASVVERDLQTGHVTRHWFCRAHEKQADVFREELAEHNAAAPEPIPNRGGLLPVYFINDWMKTYRWCAPRTWVPPVYGICADDWPGARLQDRPRRPKLSLIRGGLV